ncbi:zinc-binding dehydrogenase [Halobacteriovorax sp. HLS]|uniref:zinc-dependent alcohol dehydrogenase n=1 Tax=Halobacteriovorax sp. HLS TaxID=2234000 RepID=UPI000FD8FFF8|nr:medium chain dehydrogenase/reductase family protein [Halobacteriovorax sp. HLS]
MSWHYQYENEVFTRIENGQELVASEDEILVEPLVVGICGSDLNQIVHKRENPTIGHEWVGRIKSLGSNVSGHEVGEIVTSVAHTCCRKCKNCLAKDWHNCLKRSLLGHHPQNVISSEVLIHYSDILKVPKGLSLDAIALLEVAFIGDIAFDRATRIGLKEGDKVIIFGAGPIGVFTALSFKYRGYEPILVEKEKSRIQIAKEIGLKCLNFSAVMMSDDHYLKYDLAIDCTGDNNGPGVLKFIHLFPKVFCNVLIVGKYKEGKLDEAAYAKKGLRLTWVAAHQIEEFQASIDFWKDKIEAYTAPLTHSLGFDHINEAFEAARARKYMKCLIKKEL